MPHLIITRGLPGSGKTSWARTLGWPRVNRGEIREQLRGRLSTDWDEANVTAVQQRRVRDLLATGRTVVVDDRNLRARRVQQWRDVSATCGVPLVIADQFLAVPVEECIRRQAGRPERERVQAHVIRDMWDRYQAEQQVTASTSGAAQ